MNVLVSVCNQGWIHKGVCHALLAMQADARYSTTIITPTWRPYEHGLNRVVEDLLTVFEDHEFWLNVDADNPPTRNPLDLIPHDKDLIGLPTPVWHDAVPGDRPYYYNAMQRKADGWSPVSLDHVDTLLEVDAVGSGCMLIHRRVVELIDKPLFMREYDDRGIVSKGHDFLFCDKVVEFGFKVWTHTGYPCRHYVETDLLSQIQAFAQGVPGV